MKIDIEGDPAGTIDALRRLAGTGDPEQSQGAAPAPPGEDSREETESAAAAPETRPEFQLPEGSRQLWEERIANAGRQPSAPQPPRPAQWDQSLCNELVSNMTENARRLVAALIVAGAEGMTRNAIISEMGIELDTIRTTQVSIGHALRRVQRDNGNITLPRPVEFHKSMDAYMLNPGFRAAIREG